MEVAKISRQGLLLLAACVAVGPAAMAQIDPPNRLEMNLGPTPFDVYDNVHLASQYGMTRCPANSSVRSCYQSVLNNYRWTQKVKGVRFQFGLVGAGNSTPLNPDGSVNATWVNNVRSFFEDLRNNYIWHVTPSPNFWGWDDDAHVIVENQVHDACKEGAPLIDKIKFWRISPFGAVMERDDQGNIIYDESGNPVWYPHGKDFNEAYNCSPANTYNFVGWQAIYNVIDALLAAAQEKGLLVDELDTQNEVNVGFTVMGRLIVDNTHQDAYGNAENVLNQLAIRMGNRGFRADRVTWSVGADRTNATGPSGDPYDCVSVYGDSARIFNLSALANAIRGAQIGNPWEPDVRFGLSCGGTFTFMFDMPSYHPLPSIADVHSYPCINDVAPGREGKCNLQLADKVASEARATFTAVRGFLDSFAAPSGWRYLQGVNEYGMATARFILGETHSNTNKDGSASCENAPLTAASQTIVGFNDSPLSNRSWVDGTPGSIFRPWGLFLDSCYPVPQQVNPPYIPSLATPVNFLAWPNSGSGYSQTFSFTYLDNDGFLDILGGLIVIDTSVNGPRSCFIQFSRPSRQLYLLNDAGTVWVGPVTMGTPGTLQNSQCSINIGGSYISGQGSIFQLVLPLTFTPAFRGSRGLWMYAYDIDFLSPGFSLMGSWVVP